MDDDRVPASDQQPLRGTCAIESGHLRVPVSADIWSEMLDGYLLASGKRHLVLVSRYGLPLVYGFLGKEGFGRNAKLIVE